MPSASPSPVEERIVFGPFQLSRVPRELRRNGRPVDVGQRGLDILFALVQQPGQPISKEQLMRTAWGGRTIESSNLTVQVAKLRRILAGADGQALPGTVIQTIPRFGYVFTMPVQTAPAPLAPLHGQHRNDGAEAAPPLDWPPEPPNLFVGREAELHAVSHALRTHRLVTLIGIGGVGKTRFAMRLRPELRSHHVDGVLFVDLAALTRAHEVKEAIATALGAGPGAAVDLAITAALRSRQLLLVLDNAEHLRDTVGQVLATLLATCPGVSALVTSREALGLPGERIVRLSPLDLPPEAETLAAADALGYGAVRLFTDRAQASHPDFTLHDGNAKDVAEICRRLDGIALAIEMAVPRLSVLTPHQLALRLDDRFGTVSPARHPVRPRQRTLRAMFDWSWESLSAQERLLLQLLAGFVAGTTLTAIEAVVAAHGHDIADPLEILTALAQKSLLVVQPPTGPDRAESRYCLLETTRQYTLDRLAPAERGALSRQVALQSAQLFEHASRDWPITHSALWLARYGPEASNLRASLQWAFGQPDEAELAVRLVAASVLLWWELPGLPLREASRWYDMAMAAIGPATPPAIRGRLLLGTSWTDTLDSDTENFPAAHEAARLFQQAGEPVWQGAALWRACSAVLYQASGPSNTALLADAVAVLEGQPATKWRALCHVRQADLLMHRGALQPAMAEYDQALRMMRTIGYGYGLMVAGGNRGYLLFVMGRKHESIAALRELYAELPPGLRYPVTSLLAVTLAALGLDAEALAMVAEGLRSTIRIGMTATLARSIEALALTLVRSGDAASAARLLGFALGLHAEGRVRLGPRRLVYRQVRTLLDASLPADEQARLIAQGAAWTPAAATDTAAALCQALEARASRQAPAPPLS